MMLQALLHDKRFSPVADASSSTTDIATTHLLVHPVHNPWASASVPSRSRGLELVHAAPPVPRSAHLIELELQQFAMLLAAEMHHDLPSAVALNVDWYHEQLGRDMSTVDDAAMVRLLTLCACRDHLSLVTPEPIDIGRPYTAADQKRDESLREMWTGIGLVAALVLALLLSWWMLPTDRELQDLPVAHTTPALREAGR